MKQHNQKIRIIQMIDSLEAGGAERMAVNYANALANPTGFSGLVSTREQGPLLEQLDNKLAYLHLNKKGTFDVAALFRLRNFVKKNDVTVVHAHGTSFFLAFLLKLIYPKIKIIWHDHYGDSEFLNKRPTLVFRLVMPFFDGIIAVNQKLKSWSIEKLHCKNVIYLPNFSRSEKEVLPTTILKGTAGKRIVQLANLRPQKDHFLALSVAKTIKEFYPDWSFHLIGKDFDDAYSRKIKSLISDYNLKGMFFLYGSRQDIGTILGQATIGILTSKSEGLPLALLEYGLHRKAVVVTDVGDISLVIKNGRNGFLVNSRNAASFYDSLSKLIDDETLAIDFGDKLYKTVAENFSEPAVVNRYINWLRNKQE